MSKQVLLYRNANNILEKYYSGFRKHHSTETALTCIADQILINMSKGMVTPTIVVDLSKAFDTIDHIMLPVKLLKYGCDCHFVFWFDSYFRNRAQYMSK